MALEENKYDHLVELGDSDFEIVDGEPNIKGWDVKNEIGQQIGEVDELLFDPQSRQVRYLVVDLDGNKLGLDEDKKVLVPIGVAELYDDGHAQDEVDDIDEDNDIEDRVDLETDAVSDVETDDEDGIYDPYDDGEVIIVPATAEQLAELPAYEKGNVTPETESTVRNIFTGLGAAGLAAGTTAYTRDDFYTHDHFNENKFYDRNKLPVIEENLEVGKQEVETGGARITSRIVERPVEERLNLREEHVNVERTPVNRPVDATDGGVFQEQEFELTEHAEVPVVNKEARVVEEVSLNKEVEEREETIRETLRNTEVDAERINPDENKLS
jgi:stress response protein YsnF